MKRAAWILLVINLPGRDKTLRMRIWRALKAAGAASLRDGVYLLPDSAASRSVFAGQGAEVEAGGGSAHLLPFPGEAPVRNAALLRLFDRTTDYVKLRARVEALRRQAPRLKEAEAMRALAALRREIAALAITDFFPGKAREQMNRLVAGAADELKARFSSGEPRAVQRRVVRRKRDAYRGRTWATRERLWIDRVCSAWLIRRFIDPKAKFRWLKDARDCPKRAVGFDFDGAEFTHADHKVTFEVLLASFGLEADVGLSRLAALVHYLDVGGIPVEEAAGLATVMSGARATHRDDDALLRMMEPVLDSLHAAFQVQARR